MKRLLGAHVESSHTVLRYMGGIAQMPNRKTISLGVSVVRQPLKEASTPSHILVRVQPHDNVRGPENRLTFRE
jgi:hypothetical protein